MLGGGWAGEALESDWRLSVDLCAGRRAVCVLVCILGCTSQKSRQVICGPAEAIIATRVKRILRQTVKKSWGVGASQQRDRLKSREETSTPTRITLMGCHFTHTNTHTQKNNKGATAGVGQHSRLHTVQKIYIRTNAKLLGCTDRHTRHNTGHMQRPPV